MTKSKKPLVNLEAEAPFLQPLAPTIAPPQPTDAYYQMLQGTPTNKLRVTATKNIVIDRNGNATIEEEGFKAFFKGYSSLKGGLTTGAKKMLDAASILLTVQNTYTDNGKQPLNTAVSISLEQYASWRNYDLTPRITSTPEEEEAEKKRISNVKREMRKRINSELDLLYSLTLSWTEPGKRKNADYSDIRILQSKGIKGGYINLRFTEDIAEYLTHSYITQYPIALQAVDERNPRTYNIGYKLALHHGIYNNIEKGTNCLISVEKLLDSGGDFPTFEEIQSSRDRGHWERRIREPLEAALDKCVSSHVITRWEYANKKGAPLTDKQIDIQDYQSFTKLYIHFDIEDAPDQTEALQRKAAEREKKPRRKAASKKKAAEGGE